ncbi:hypothetical protein [Euzebya tangerina]|uniref:hypothetical protein n=1 Tax=Euzebya tangerina TaxID=591198 RepID=UPI0013C328F1|nr:hypothetical protein [Euzebya tangerina]
MSERPAQEGADMEQIRIDRRRSRLRALKRRTRDLMAAQPLRYSAGGADVDEELLGRIDRVLAEASDGSGVGPTPRPA